MLKTGFRLIDASIPQIQDAYRSRQLSARELVQLYLDRIDAYDQRGPQLNCVIAVDPRALDEARRLDDAFATSGPVGPLHGVPVIVKDQVDVAGLPTTLGSVVFKDYRPNFDAFVVERLRDAGAIVLAKATLAEMAMGDTHGSLFGATRNPYALDRTPGGSSGGPAVAIAASLGAVGVGQEGYASIRRPAAWCSLAGMRPSPGLISRTGVYQGWPARTGSLGPITRSVEDLARLLDILVGYDREDPLTAYGYRRFPTSFIGCLDEGGLRGARLGIVREPMGLGSLPSSPDFAEIDGAFDAAVRELAALGATLVDPLAIPRLTELLMTRVNELAPGESESSWHVYFSRGSNAPFATEAAFRSSPQYHDVVTRPSSWARGSSREEYLRSRDELLTSILQLMADHRLDAIVHKSVEHHPQLISEGAARRDTYFARGAIHLNTFLIDVPAITVPAGWTSDGLPVGITFQGRPYDDGTVIKLAYAYEHGTHHRRPPTSAPPLPGEP